MFSLIAQALQFFRVVGEETLSSPASALMESADLRSDAYEAQELRVAATAWLSVVR
jgi:hypothetical protein